MAAFIPRWWGPTAPPPGMRWTPRGPGGFGLPLYAGSACLSPARRNRISSGSGLQATSTSPALAYGRRRGRRSPAKLPAVGAHRHRIRAAGRTRRKLVGRPVQRVPAICFSGGRGLGAGRERPYGEKICICTMPHIFTRGYSASGAGAWSRQAAAMAPCISQT